MTSGASHPRSTGLPSPEQVTELLADEFARAGFEVEAVTVDSGRNPARITVVADGDAAPDLDALAELSRLASERLDSVDTGEAGYLLEVTSPGVDRPLTAAKHFRRARGRKVTVELADGSSLVGRVAAPADDAIDLVVPVRGGFAVRTVPLADVRKAVVEVEFSPPKPQELELVERTSDEH